MSIEDRRHPGVPLRMAADYAWRFLVIAAAAYVVLRVFEPLYELIIALVVALFITALLRPVLAFLRRRGVPRGLATAMSVLFAFVVVGGILAYVTSRGVDDFPALGDQINRIIPHVKNWLINGPLHVNASSVNNISNTLSKEVTKNTGVIASSALSTGKTVLTVLAGLVLAIFVTVFLLYDGEGVWEFLVRLLPRDARPRVDAAGRAAWLTLSKYIRGTLIVAAFHGVVIAITLAILGVPLVAPLALVVALGAFVPLVGAIVAGALAVAVAAITHGVVAAIVVLAVLVIDNQVEAHVLQPFVVGRYVHIHPLATVLALAAGELLLGIFGAVIAVPTVACANAAIRCLVREPEEGKAMDPAKTDSDPSLPAESLEAELNVEGDGAAGSRAGEAVIPADEFPGGFPGGRLGERSMTSVGPGTAAGVGLFFLQGRRGALP